MTANFVDIKLEDRCLLNKIEWQAERLDLNYSQYSFSSDRFAHAAIDNYIFVQDTFLGASKNLFSQEAEVTIWRYFHIYASYGIALYETDLDVRLSVISLDFDSNKYIIVGKSHLVYEKGDAEPQIEAIYKTLLAYKTIEPSAGRALHLLDLCLPHLKYKKSILLTEHSRCFTLIDEDFVFLEAYHELQEESYQIEAIYLLNSDGVRTKVSNSKIKLKHNLNIRNGTMYGYSSHGCWYNQNLFVLYQLRIHDDFGYGPTSNFFATFDMNAQKWSRLHLNLPRLEDGFIKFNVHDGILSILHHIEEFEQNKLTRTNIKSHRFQIGKPERLHNLALFKIRNLDFSGVDKLFRVF